MCDKAGTSKPATSRASASSLISTTRLKSHINSETIETSIDDDLSDSNSVTFWGNATFCDHAQTGGIRNIHNAPVDRSKNKRVYKHFSFYIHGDQQKDSLHHEQLSDNLGDIFPKTSKFGPKHSPQVADKLEAILRTRASELCGMNDPLLAEHNVRIAPLQISRQSHCSQLANEFGHYHHREELAAIFNKVPESDIDHTELFRVSNAQALLDAESNASTAAARAKYQLINGNIVGIVGQAGIGKTTLTKCLVKKILDEALYDIEYVFYLEFREIDFAKKMHLLDFLTGDSSLFDSFSHAELKEAFNILDKNKKVGIVLDGFDEADMKKKDKPLQGKCSLHDINHPEIFIKNLLCGNVFPHAKKIITSRPQQLFDLHKDSKPKFIVNVLGLDEEGQKQICSDLCQQEVHTQSKMKDVVNYIKDRPDLQSFCYVPINCILVTFCVLISFINGDFINMDSLTTVFVATLHHFIDNGLLGDDSFQIKNLCSLAFRGFLSNKLYFEKSELDNAKISQRNASSFLNATITKRIKLKLLQGIASSQIYFSHLILQEFFVAFHLLYFTTVEEFKQSFKDLTESKYEMVSKFLFGLCNTTTMEYLHKLLPSEVFAKAIDVESKKKLLQKLAKTNINKSDDIFYPNHSIVSISKCSWFHEMRDKAFTIKIIKNFGEKVALRGMILPSDVPAIHYVLRAIQKKCDLTIKRPDFIASAFENFFSEMKITLQSPFLMIDLLDLVADQISNEDFYSIALCINKTNVVVLNIVNGRDHPCFSIDGIRILLNAIQEQEKPLKCLSISNIGASFGDAELVEIFSCISFIESVSFLGATHLTAAGIRDSSNAIENLRQPMCHLNLTNSHIDDKGLQILSSCLNNIEKLSIPKESDVFQRSCCSIEGFKCLTSALKDLPKPIQYLNVSGHHFGDEGLVAVASCLDKIQTLVIGSCVDDNITMKGIETLATALRNLKAPMIRLALLCQLTEKARKVLSQCGNVSKLEVEFIDYIHFDDSSLVSLVSYCETRVQSVAMTGMLSRMSKTKSRKLKKRPHPNAT